MVVMLCVWQAPEPSEEVQHVTELPQALARLQAQGRLCGVPRDHPRCCNVRA